MGEYARHGEGPLVTSIQSAREKGFPCYYESSSDEEDEDDDLYTGRSMYSNTGHFRNIVFNTNSETDLIYCMEGYKSYIEDLYGHSDSDSKYFSADESLEESQDMSCQSFPNGSKGVVGSEKSTLSNHVIRGSGKRRSSFGEEIDDLYVCSNNSSCVKNLTLSGTSLADQGELDEVESLSTPTTQTSYVKSTPEGSRLSKFKLVDELYNENIMSNFDDVDLHNNIWSVLTDRLMFSKQDDELVKNKAKLVYDNNQLKTQNAKKRYFDIYNSNVPLEIGTGQSKERSPKYQDDKFNAANSNKPNNYKGLAVWSDGEYTEHRYENIQVELSSKFNPNQHICATYLWSEEDTEKPLIVDAHDDNYNKMWFKEGRFPINIHGESVGYLLNGTGVKIKVNTLIDSGCSKPILYRDFYERNKFLHLYPIYKIETRGVRIANDTIIPVDEAIHFMIKFQGHEFEIIAYLANMTVDYDFLMGQKSMYELEAGANFRNLSFQFIMRPLNLYSSENVNIKPGQTKTYSLELKDLPPGMPGPKEEHDVIVKLKTFRSHQLVQTLSVKWHNNRILLHATNKTDKMWKIRKGEMMGSMDMRTLGYFTVTRENLNRIMKDHCKFLTEEETYEYFGLLNKDHEDIINYAQDQVR